MDFLINQSKKTTGGGVVLGDGLNHTMELVVADSQSDGARAAQVAGDLIQNSKVDLVMSGGGPEVVLPVADQCEAMGVPSLSTNTPWEPWVFARKGAMDKAFKWTYLACGGITEFMQADVHTISPIPPTDRRGLTRKLDFRRLWRRPAFALSFPASTRRASKTLRLRSVSSRRGVRDLSGISFRPGSYELLAPGSSTGLQSRRPSHGIAVDVPG
jgi:hypothetical protein